LRSLELEMSYPSRSCHRIVDYLLQDDSQPLAQPQDSGGLGRSSPIVSTVTPEDKSTKRFKIFISALLHTINNMGQSKTSNLKDYASSQQIWEFLWYIFAEPDSQ
jgi:hypothetical protein